jgi:hypothetical protein
MSSEKDLIPRLAASVIKQRTTQNIQIFRKPQSCDAMSIDKMPCTDLSCSILENPAFTVSLAAPTPSWMVRLGKMLLGASLENIALPIAIPRD